MRVVAKCTTQLDVGRDNSISDISLAEKQQHKAEWNEQFRVIQMFFVDDI